VQFNIGGGQKVALG